ncbi:D-alanine--D-alanine ligase [Sphingomonas sp.]|uniref:D-alanine--D-alanine ligase n=1 Tax=Sphingomonas sp. TaxID=28214 RepID=UPI0025ED7733|nr:D-alanine--D-alanine ligase [Sphingomonas sp.]MBV9527115.1 D-alanine--D-alanine ligase [Sphingomonas sp.]
MTLDRNLHVVVLMGGWSNERDVSLTSGRGVAAALRERGWSNVIELDMDRDVARRLADLKPDIVFNALHGTPGEDGTVQGMMDLMGLRYTHSGVETSVIAIDKELTKMVLVPHGIRMPAGTVVDSESIYAADPIARPYVLKPVNEGSSVGVAIVTEESNYGNPIARSAAGPWQEFDKLLAEPFIKGRELTVAVLGDEALAVTELKIESGFYDYEHKYTDGRTVHVCPADVPADIAKVMMDMAAKSHRLLGCKGASRSDFRWDDEQGEAGLYLLEVNTQPGMTPLSLVPEQAKLRGIAYGELVERLIEEALA